MKFITPNGGQVWNHQPTGEDVSSGASCFWDLEFFIYDFFNYLQASSFATPYLPNYFITKNKFSVDILEIYFYISKNIFVDLSANDVIQIRTITSLILCCLFIMKNSNKHIPLDIEEHKTRSKEMASLCLNSVRPILFGHLPQISNNPYLRNGAITFISTGKNSFGITNYHVIKDYSDTLEKYENISCQIDTLPFNLLERIIDKSSKLDIATVYISKEEFEKINVVPLYHKTWPVPEPKKGEKVFFIGYPAECRSVITPEHIDMPYGELTMLIESISETKICIQFKRENWIVYKHPIDPSNLYNWGGISGSGIFRFRDITPELLAISFEHHKLFDLLYCARSDLVLEDGAIKQDFIF